MSTDSVTDCVTSGHHWSSTAYSVCCVSLMTGSVSCPHTTHRMSHTHSPPTTYDLCVFCFWRRKRTMCLLGQSAPRKGVRYEIVPYGATTISASVEYLQLLLDSSVTCPVAPVLVPVLLSHAVYAPQRGQSLICIVSTVNGVQFERRQSRRSTYC